MTEQSLPEWKSDLFSYRTVVSVEFHTKEDQHRATQLFWRKDHALYRVPRDFIDGKIIALPEEAVKYLRVAQIKFTAKPIGSMADLTPKERAELRATRCK